MQRVAIGKAAAFPNPGRKVLEIEVVGGQILQAAIPALAGAAGGGVDIGSFIGNAVGGGATGAIATLLVGLVKNMMSGHQTR